MMRLQFGMTTLGDKVLGFVQDLIIIQKDTSENSR